MYWKVPVKPPNIYIYPLAAAETLKPLRGNGEGEGAVEAEASEVPGMREGGRRAGWMGHNMSG
jgi:hypothetical protein